MTEYIEREKVLKTLEEIKTEKEKEFEKRTIFIEGLTTVFNELCAIKSVIEIIKKDIPAADVQPVKHGRWITSEIAIDSGCTSCSCCRSEYYIGDLQALEGDNGFVMYCPNCGARMDATQNIETCICCGETIPEGRQVCPKCESEVKNDY